MSLFKKSMKWKGRQQEAERQKSYKTNRKQLSGNSKSFVISNNFKGTWIKLPSQKL